MTRKTPLVVDDTENQELEAPKAPPAILSRELTMEPIDSLEAHPANPRKGDLATITESIDRNGFYGAVVAQRGTRYILAGNHRWQAAKAAGLEEIPVIWLDVDDDEALRILLVDNRANDKAGYDDESLTRLLARLYADTQDLSGTGYTQQDLDELIDKMKIQVLEPQTDEDEIPDLPGEAISMPGDLIRLGRHSLLVGDATVITDVERLMGGELADLVDTDPPYNVDYQGGTDEALKIENDNMSDDDFYQFLLAMFSNAWAVTKAGGPIYIYHADSEGINFRRAMADAGWDQKQTLIWVKNSLVLGRQDYQWQHEPILYGWKPGAAHAWYGDRNKTTVIEETPMDLKALSKKELVELVQRFRTAENTTVLRANKPAKNDIHPTMKPVALIEANILNSSRRGERVLDLCAGGGASLIAAEKTGRIWHGLELDPRYADRIVTRWERYTGQTAARP